MGASRPRPRAAVETRLASRGAPADPRSSEPAEQHEGREPEREDDPGGDPEHPEGPLAEPVGQRHPPEGAHHEEHEARRLHRIVRAPGVVEAEVEQEILASAEFVDMHDVTKVTQDWELGKTTIFGQLELKLRYWESLPWTFAGLVHNDDGVARAIARKSQKCGMP